MRRRDNLFERLLLALILLALLVVILYDVKLWREIDEATRARQEQSIYGGPVVELPQAVDGWYTYSPEAGALVPKYMDWEED